MKNFWIIFLVCLLPNCRSVGDRSVESDLKIIGGALFEGMPEVGLLTRNGAMHCTATLIQPTRIVTAAHCLDARIYANAKFAFALGKDLENAVPLEIVKTVRHPLYDSVSNNYDIAYADLKDPAPIQTAVVYKGDFPALKGSSLRLVGYGAAGLSTPGRGSGTKRLVTMRVANVNATKIRFDETGKSACDGDSGGPAFVETSNGQFQLAGVTSCGAVDCKSYGVYTRIDPFMEFLGLTQTADPSLSLPLCGAALNSKICEGDSIVSCQQDCFEPITTKISCASANGGRCTGLRGAARCIDNSYLAQTLVFQKLSYTANEGFKTAPYKALGVFVDNGHPKDSVYGATDDEGVIRVEMTAGDHALKIRRGDRSYTPHALKSFVSKDQSETHSYILGDINLQITVSGGGQTAYYITGAGPLFGDWQRARRLNQLGMQWIYEDALAGRSDYKIMEIQSLDSEIAVDPMLWSKAKVQTVPVRAASYPDAWVTVKLKASDL